MSTVYAVASGKGGVGKTTTVVNLGVVLAEAGHSVVIVDADLGMANVAGLFDFESDGKTLHHVLSGSASVDEAIREGPSGVAVVPGATSLEEFGSANPAKLHEVVATLREEYDIVLVDCGAGVSHDTIIPLGLADSVLLVTTPWAVAIADTVKTRELTDLVDGTVAGAVLTRVGAEEDEASVDDVNVQLGTDVLSVIPEDPAVEASTEARTPVALFAPDSPAAEAYVALAAVLTGADEPPDPPDDSPARESTADGADEGETPNRTGADGDSERSADEDGSGERNGETDVDAEEKSDEDSAGKPDEDSDEKPDADGADDEPTLVEPRDSSSSASTSEDSSSKNGFFGRLKSILR